MTEASKYACVCCGYQTFTREDHLWEICEVCFWQSCPIQDIDPDYIGGPNPISLRQAQQNFVSFGACEEDMLKNTRKLSEDESAWRVTQE
jgi:Cysteine-rich CPCC